MAKCAAVLVCVLLLLSGAPASAQSLKLPTIVFAGATTADLATTYVGLSRGLHEQNVFLRPLRNRPATTVIAGAAINFSGLWAWNRYVGRRHRKLARIGLYIAAAAEIGFAVHNARLVASHGQPDGPK